MMSLQSIRWASLLGLFVGMLGCSSDDGLDQQNIPGIGQTNGAATPQTTQTGAGDTSSTTTSGSGTTASDGTAAAANATGTTPTTTTDTGTSATPETGTSPATGATTNLAGAANATGAAGSSAASNTGSGTGGAGSGAGATTGGAGTADTQTDTQTDTTGGTTPETTPATDTISCTFNVTQSMSDVITTVGIVEFSVDLPSVDAATVEFGLDTNYGMSAPVDLNEPGYRTLMLGMKTARDYHFRVAATSGVERCSSQDFTLTTGATPNGVNIPTVTTNLPDQLIGGYLVSARWGANNGGPAFILDADGELVWWFPAEDDAIRARFSYDGKAIWIRNTAQADGTGVVQRVSLDGLEVKRWDVPRTTHDLAVIPDGKLGMIAHTDGCDEIVEFDPTDGSLTSLFNLEQAHGQTNCHVNYLAYSALDDSFYISDWQASSVVKIARAGQLLWVLNGDATDFSGTSWTRQHGMHILAPDHLLIFSNGAPGENSQAIEFQLNETSMVATELWRYDGGVQAQFGGDIQRLDNGNTLVTYSSAGVMHEVNAAGDLVQELAWPLDSSVSYAVKRPTLYGGPPPKIH